MNREKLIEMERATAQKFDFKVGDKVKIAANAADHAGQSGTVTNIDADGFLHVRFNDGVKSFPKNDVSAMDLTEVAVKPDGSAEIKTDPSGDEAAAGTMAQTFAQPQPGDVVKTSQTAGQYKFLRVEGSDAIIQGAVDKTAYRVPLSTITVVSSPRGTMSAFGFSPGDKVQGINNACVYVRDDRYNAGQCIVKSAQSGTEYSVMIGKVSKMSAFDAGASVHVGSRVQLSSGEEGRVTDMVGNRVTVDLGAGEHLSTTTDHVTEMSSLAGRRAACPYCEYSTTLDARERIGDHRTHGGVCDGSGRAVAKFDGVGRAVLMAAPADDAAFAAWFKEAYQIDSTRVMNAARISATRMRDLFKSGISPSEAVEQLRTGG